MKCLVLSSWSECTELNSIVLGTLLTENYGQLTTEAVYCFLDELRPVVLPDRCSPANMRARGMLRELYMDI